MALRDFFDCGSVSRSTASQAVKFSVSKKEDLLYKIIPHFDEYPLISQKHADFILFKKAVMIMSRQEHLTEKGLLAIINLKASMNWGLSTKLIEAFPNYIAVPRPIVHNQVIRHPEWLAGFVSGEGCFLVFIAKSKKSKFGFQIRLRFTITQHSRDEKLLTSFVLYFNCGMIYTRKNKALTEFVCIKFSDNFEKIIPFFKQHPIIGVRAQDFEDFCQVAELMQNKAHLTIEGLNEIRKIQAGMNRGRPLEAEGKKDK